MWLSSVSGPNVPVCTPSNVKGLLIRRQMLSWGSPPRLGSQHQWAPEQLLGGVECIIHNVPEDLNWIQFWGTWGPVNASLSPSSHSGHMSLVVVLHQKEPRAHCTTHHKVPSVRVFIVRPCHFTLVRNSNPPRICITRPSLSHLQTGQAECCWRQHNIHHGVFRLFHVCHMWSVWTCSHQWRKRGTNGEPDSFGGLWRMPVELHSARLWAQIPLEDFWSVL